MKKLIQLSLFLVFLVSLLMFACNGTATKAKADGTSVANQPAIAETVSADKASFSVKLNGTLISGGQIDELQLQNTAFTYPSRDNTTKRLLFSLISDQKGKDVYSFRFSIPGKVGSFTKVLQDGQPFNITVDLQSGDFSRYNARSVTVTISSLTASRVSGIFSGTLTLSGDTPRGTVKEITVTEGKFDIPFSTGKLKPE